MNNHSGENEGFRMLEEIVCDAKPDADTSAELARGKNEGIHMLPEVIWDASRGCEVSRSGAASQDQTSSNESQCVEFLCPHCGQRIKAEAALAGKQTKCPNPNCAALVDVPG